MSSGRKYLFLLSIFLQALLANNSKNLILISLDEKIIKIPRTSVGIQRKMEN